MRSGASIMHTSVVMSKPKPKRGARPMGEIVRHAVSVQKKVDEVRENLHDHEVSSDSAGGKVQVTVTCEGLLRRIQVDSSVLENEGLEMTLDLIVATANKALEEAERVVDLELTKATGGIRIPGING